MASKFVGALETIGKDFEKGLSEAVKYALPAEKLVALLFPSVAPAAVAAVDAVTLIQNAVLEVEQKYAASGMQSGTGTQKAAEVATLAEAAVTTLLAQDGVTVDSAYFASIVTAVVAVLNIQPPVPVAAVKAAPAL